MGSCEDWRDWNHQIGVCKKDPMSHRIIEKRRRDRMNNCLADLSRLIPAEYLKKGRGRIEKTEIIEMAIKHMKFLQAQTCNNLENYETKTENDHCLFNDKQYVNDVRPQESELSLQDQYKYGYQECLAETMHFLVELEGYIPTDTLCVKLIAHLQKYFEKIAKGDKIVYRAPLENISSSHNYDFKINGMNTGSITDDVEKNGANCMITTVNSDDNYLNNGNTNSQLREMLVGPHRNTLYVPTIRPKIIRHSSSEPPSPQPELNNSDTHSVNGSYKFKNYIKERFSAEHSNSNSSAENSKSPSFGDLYANKRKTEYSSRITYSPPNLNDIKINDHYPGSRPIPIFALHSKGSFYIPLTIDSHLLTPFLTELNYDYGVTTCSSMVLHPVTISVNFNRTTELSKEIECKPILSPNINLTPRIQNGPLLIIPECR